MSLESGQSASLDSQSVAIAKKRRSQEDRGIPYAKQLSLMGADADAGILKQALQRRLTEEGENELAEKLAKCGQTMRLWCRDCGHMHEAKTRCNRKWCPVCARMVAAKRSAKLAAVARSFQWPLFVTLTMRNIPADECAVDFVRDLRKAFGKLRNRKLWKSRVAGGAAAIEVTNTGAGWHPHIHALIDCRWLAIRTPAPRPTDSPARIAALCEDAAKEFSALWAKCLKADYTPSVKTKRASHEAAKEVMKYACKGSDLVESPDSIGPVLRMLDGTRLVTTFGSAFGIDVEEPERPPFACPNGHQSWTLTPPGILAAADGDGLTARQKIALRRSAELEAKLEAILAAESAEPF